MDIFLKKLENLFGKRLQIVLKDNKSTFLRFIKVGKNRINMMLHICFLKAPDNILLSLKKYVVNRDKSALSQVRAFVDKSFEARTFIAPIKTLVEGDFYNLKDLFLEVVDEYFKDGVDLFITWTKRHSYKKASHVTFASYDGASKLIKINRMLDDNIIPRYFIKCVIYHEILHHIYPVRMGQRGRREIHHKEFREKEKEHPDYKKAREFSKDFVKKFKKRIINGRT